MNIIMLGAPGAGKGTISQRLTEIAHIPHIATGDIFRENIKNNTELGKLAKSYIDSGTLVPDELTVNLVVDRIKNDDCKKGFILDGFPRTMGQAEAFDVTLNKENNKINLVIFVNADEEKIIKRLSGRRVCPKCNASYHIETLKPKVDGICDNCGENLIQRKDDTESIIKDRLEVYKKETYPLVDYYKNKGIVKEVDGFDNLDHTIEIISKYL